MIINNPNADVPLDTATKTANHSVSVDLSKQSYTYQEMGYPDVPKDAWRYKPDNWDLYEVDPLNAARRATLVSKETAKAYNWAWYNTNARLGDLSQDGTKYEVLFDRREVSNDAFVRTDSATIYRIDNPAYKLTMLDKYVSFSDVAKKILEDAKNGDKSASDYLKAV